jgi:hypothetical protein
VAQVALALPHAHARFILWVSCAGALMGRGLVKVETRTVEYSIKRQKTVAKCGKAKVRAKPKARAGHTAEMIFAFGTPRSQMQIT